MYLWFEWWDLPDPSVCHSGFDQVWSLTQLYSVDFSKSRIDVKKCVFKKRTIKVCVSCCWRCPGTSAPSAAHLTVSLYRCSSGSNARGELRAWEGRRVSSKSPSRVRDGDEGVAGRNVRELCFPDEGSLICPPGKSMSCHKKETEKYWVSVHTWQKAAPTQKAPSSWNTSNLLWQLVQSAKVV